MADSLGIGAAPDAAEFGDSGSNTLAHLLAAYYRETGEKLALPYLSQLGLIDACEQAGNTQCAVSERKEPIAAYGYAKELSSGKDTPSGHWEIAGVPVLFDWGYFEKKPNCFPQEFVDKFIARANLPGIIGNCHSSGTVILDALGEEPMQTGMPICYTSTDSVFQIACHEETFGLERLYEICEIARELLDEYNIGRVNLNNYFIGYLFNFFL